jgi:hypothetical protein
MTIVNPPVPVPGPRGTEETNASSAINAILADYNGNITDANLSAAAAISAAKLADAAKLGLTDGATIRRGKSIIATTEARTNTAYGLMTTPDRVTGLVLPTDGLIAVLYQATWAESVAGAAAAEIFLGSNAVVAATYAGQIAVNAALGGATPGGFCPLATDGGGLVSFSANPGSYGSDVTTGQIVGLADPSHSETSPFSGQALVRAGPCYIFAAAGTYDVSVQFKASSGSVTAKNRKLWAWTTGF